VRCPECEPKPPAPARYCDCCGHKIPDHLQHEQVPSVAAPADPQNSDLYDWAPSPNRTSDLRCPSCAGPSFDGNRCAACREQEVQRTESVTPALATDDAASATPANGETHHAPPEPQSSQSVEKPVAARAKTVEPEARTPDSPIRRSTAADAVYAEKMAKPAVAPKRPTVTAPVQAEAPTPQTKQQPAALVAIGVVIAALAAGGYWYRVYAKPTPPRVQQPAAVVPTEDPAATDGAGVRPAEHPENPAGVQDRTPAPPPQAPTAAPSKARPIASTPASVNQKTAANSSESPSANGRKPATPVTSARQAAATLAADRAVRPAAPVRREILLDSARTSSPAAAKPVVEVTEDAKPPVVASASLTGPIFDLSEVNESPRIETRAEPRLPADLRGRSIKEVVVVRAVVSQSGRPSRISLLRRSKAGPALDDVVLDAVNQWTFSPARKRGEPVNCWYNFAVQVGGTD
jgi:TonB family protein